MRLCPLLSQNQIIPFTALLGTSPLLNLISHTSEEERTVSCVGPTIGKNVGKPVNFRGGWEGAGVGIQMLF